MTEDIAALGWHDALLLNLFIDRSNPGHADTLELLVEWTDGTQSEIAFHDCYAVNAQMNFNVVCKETIRSFRVDDDGDDIASIKAKWKASGTRVEGVKRYAIETNSTSSIIKIYALSAEVSPAR